MQVIEVMLVIRDKQFKEESTIIDGSQETKAMKAIDTRNIKESSGYGGYSVHRGHTYLRGYVHCSTITVIQVVDVLESTRVIEATNILDGSMFMKDNL